MELHQIRYFLSLSQTLNFTRAADECNVSQPALSRAISQLEAELGGDLFRRERNLTHITELGQAMLQPLRQCYNASTSAKTLAREFLKEGHAPLNLALSRSIEIDVLSPMLSQIAEAFPKIEIRITRDPPQAILDKLKKGDVEVAVAGPLPDEWDRLENARLFEQRFGLLLDSSHRLANQAKVTLADLQDERLVSWPHFSLTDQLIERINQLGHRNVMRHEVQVIDDVPKMVQFNFGVGMWPLDRKTRGNLVLNQVENYDITRWVHVFSVFGRQHSPAAKTLATLLRVSDWSMMRKHEHAPETTLQ
jgi:DNA-binding transcriptional LysR family regulator